MKGYRFYADMPREWASKSGCKSHKPFTRATLREWAERGGHCNVTAVILDDDGRPMRTGSGCVEIIGAVMFHANSGVGLSSADDGWLRERAVRIDEALARKLHPALFQRLDTDE